MQKRWLTAMLLAGLWVGCGDEAMVARPPSLNSALTSAPELLELETLPVRQELFREMVRSTELGAGQKAGPGVLLVVARGNTLFAAPALETHADLLQSWDAGAGPAALDLDSGPDRWSDEPRDSLQGLSEREAASLLSTALLQRWGIVTAAPVRVDRALAAPYAAAYVDGVLRVNPAFLYLAAAGSTL